jgi:hypothetical protein
MSVRVIAFDGKTLAAAVGQFGGRVCSIDKITGSPLESLSPYSVVAAYGTPRIVAAMRAWMMHAPVMAHVQDLVTYDVATEAYFSVIIMNRRAYAFGPNGEDGGLTSRLECKQLHRPAVWSVRSHGDSNPSVVTYEPAQDGEGARAMITEHIGSGMDVDEIFPGFEEEDTA